MPVTLGSQADHGFDEPLGLMRDCHRRIEKFLGVLLHVVAEGGGAVLDDEHRRAMESALNYFQKAAPSHTRDEEDSLFPRLRNMDDPRVREAIARIDSLESDHVDADAKHTEADRLGRRWLEQGTLPAGDVAQLATLFGQLHEIYHRHIAEEDDVIFPLAGEVLTSSALAEIGREMAQRRGIDPDFPEPRCKHARARRGLLPG